MLHNACGHGLPTGRRSGRFYRYNRRLF